MSLLLFPLLNHRLSSHKPILVMRSTRPTTNTRSILRAQLTRHSCHLLHATCHLPSIHITHSPALVSLWRHTLRVQPRRIWFTFFLIANRKKNTHTHTLARMLLCVCVSLYVCWCVLPNLVKVLQTFRSARCTQRSRVWQKCKAKTIPAHTKVNSHTHTLTHAYTHRQAGKLALAVPTRKLLRFWLQLTLECCCCCCCGSCCCCRF